MTIALKSYKVIKIISKKSAIKKDTKNRDAHIKKKVLALFLFLLVSKN